MYKSARYSPKRNNLREHSVAKLQIIVGLIVLLNAHASNRWTSLALSQIDSL
jgi:hypothetical protein